MSKDVAVPAPGGLAHVRTYTSSPERFQAALASMEKVDDARCSRPIPKFMLELPWADADGDEVSERIIAQMLASDNPYEAKTGETVSGKDLVGRKVTVYDLRVNPSDKPGGWGAYLLCDVTIDDSEAHEVMTVGAKQSVAILAYAHVMGDLPITGTPTIVTTTGDGNQVLGFVVERDF